MTNAGIGCWKRYATTRARVVARGQRDVIQERHFQFVLDVYRGAEPGLRGFDQIEQLRVLRLEQENVRAALAWACRRTDARWVRSS